MAAAHIIDIEARTPVGMRAGTAAAAVRAGICRVAEHPFMLDPMGEPLRGARDPFLDPVLFGQGRLFALAADPLERICVRLSGALPPDLTVILALPERRPGWTERDEAALVDALTQVLRTRFRRARLVATASGHAGSLQAIQAASALIGRGEAEICLVGGVDSYFHPETLDWLFEQRRVVTSETRSAFFPGEAAGFVALASAASLRQLRLASLARVGSVGVAVEHCLPSHDKECLGLGLAQALLAAGEGTSGADPVDRILCDINGERYRAQEWGMAVLKTPHLFRDATAYEAPAISWGDVGAASGALFAILAAQGWARGYARGRRALLFAGSGGGTRAAVLLERTSERQAS